MSRILVVYLLLVSFLCHAQKIKFQIKAITPCHPNGKIDSSDYYLTGANKSIYRNKSGIILLPRPGKYKLHHWDEPATDFPTINIATEGPFVYTIKETRIARRTYSMHGHYKYFICGELINGYEEDFYPNGHPRIRGTFIEGNPKDSVVIFYPSGITQKRTTYLPLENLVEEYDSLANLKMVGYFSNRSFYPADYRKTEYFPHG